MIDTDIKEYWEDRHKIKDTAALSGCLYDETIDFLQLQPYIKPGIKVLEVGVGFGFVTKKFFEIGIDISALDIADVALERVKNYCEEVYNVKDIHLMPSCYFDVIICHNVVQHVATAILIEELKHCIRSLKPDGVFAIEFVSSVCNSSIKDMGVDADMILIRTGSCCRTPNYLEKLINDVGGVCNLVVDNKCDLGHITGCHVFHIKKSKELTGILNKKAGDEG